MDSFVGERAIFVTGSVIVAASWYSLPDMAVVSSKITPLALACFCASTGLAFADVALDSVAVKSHSGSRETASKKMSDIWIIRTSAAAAATIAAGLLSVKAASTVTCIVAMVMPVFSIPRVKISQDKTTIPIRKIVIFGLSALVMAAGPNSDPVMTVLLGTRYGFHRGAFASLGLIECLAMTLGSVMYKTVVRHKNPVRVIVVSTLSMSVASLMFLFLFITPGFTEAFCTVAVTSVVYLVASSFVSSVLLTEAARGLPKGSEAAFYTSIAAAFNLGSIISTLGGGALAEILPAYQVFLCDSAGNLLFLGSVFLIRS